MTYLTPMTEPEFATYQAASIPDFAKEKVASGQWAAEQSLELARQSFTDLLPQGVVTPDNFFFTVRDSASLEAVGMLWFAAQQRGAQRVAYVYDVAIDPKHQRKGHGKRVFAALEDEVRLRGLSGIALHVFGHNTGAQALYRALGFEATNINMFKPLP